MKNVITITCILITLSGCVDPARTSKITFDSDVLVTTAEIEKNRALLIGGWIGSRPTPQGGKREELAILKKDGTFEFRFRETDKRGNKKIVTDVGVWGLVGNVHFTIVTSWYENGKKYSEDITKARNYQVFEVITLDKHIFEYRNIVTNHIYRLEKAQRGYVL